MLVSTGDKFCRLTLVSEAGVENGHTIWNCRCDCGAECTARIDKLKFGRKKSCGCLKRELVDAAKKGRIARVEGHERTAREASYARDQLKLKTLLKQKGEFSYQHFDLTGSPRRVAKDFREWAFIVAAVLWHGPTDDSVTITADIKVNK